MRGEGQLRRKVKDTPFSFDAHFGTRSNSGSITGPPGAGAGLGDAGPTDAGGRGADAGDALETPGTSTSMASRWAGLSGAGHPERSSASSCSFIQRRRAVQGWCMAPSVGCYER